MKPIKSVIATMLLMLTLSCTNDSDTPLVTEPFVGSWEVIEVVKDGELQPIWNNVNLLISQQDNTGGSYQMTDTPYDSIWSRSGTWLSSDRTSTIVLDDTLMASYAYRLDTLKLTKYLPFTSIPCDDSTGPCLTVVTGQWNFVFRRSN